MKQQQTITEINKIVSQLSEKKLNDVLLYLKKYEQHSDNKSDQKILDKIFKEDKGLLKKLAK